MVYVLTLLFISPFLDIKESRWFVSTYAFILLLAREIRVYLELVGSDYFLFTSYTQLACMCLSVFLLKDKIRVVSVSVFVLFSAYNYLMYLWWGFVTPIFHNWIFIAVIAIQTMVVTFPERGFRKNIYLITVTSIISLVAYRYI